MLIACPLKHDKNDKTLNDSHIKHNIVVLNKT